MAERKQSRKTEQNAAALQEAAAADRSGMEQCGASDADRDGVGQCEAAAGGSGTGERESRSIEQTFARIDELIVQLESPEISLEQSFQAYEEGMKLLKSCNEQIDRVEKKVLALSGDGGFDELGE